jgi:hypothetical protein
LPNGHVRKTEATSDYSAPLQILMRRRRVAAGNGLSTGLSTTIKYVRRSCSSAECSSLGVARAALPQATV